MRCTLSASGLLISLEEPVRKALRVLVIVIISAAAALPVLLQTSKVRAEPNWAQAAAAKRPVVVELFTSQGCSSCPPADALLQELAKRSKEFQLQLYPLSFHVDYWNYLGWTDPYSGNGATDRQRQYAKVFGGKSVYTPQAVINGRQQVVGSNRSALYQALTTEFAAAEPKTKLHVISRDGVGVLFSVENLSAPALLRVIYSKSYAENQVPKGENAGSTLSHTNVVQQIDSTAVEASVTQKRLELRKVPSADTQVLLLLQDETSLEIISVVPVS